MKKTCFVQTHHTNIRMGDMDPRSYCIDALKRSGIFDHIVLAAADLPENRMLFDVAERWGVECILGPVDDMVERMLKVCDETEADVLVRVLVDWFYIDVDLVAKMVDKVIADDLDYVALPYDFDMKFGADVHSRRGLAGVAELFISRPELAERHKFRPWFFIEENPMDLWRVGFFDGVPTYSNERFHRLRSEIREACPVAWDLGTHFHYHEYAYALGHISGDDVVLDLACGWGAGTALIAKSSAKAVGVDVNPEYVEAARERHAGDNCEFHLSDASKLPMPDDFFDVVVSVHTMEHVDDDGRFLDEVARVLKPDGRLIIEVPLRMRTPFVFTGEPFMPDHVREYEFSELKSLMEAHFNIEAAYGANRGNYCESSKARNAAMFVASQKRAAG